jgi:iron complex transport system ATP-binding protein
MLEARDITIKYGERVAVANVSLVLRPGEITALIGPNGAGKSTLLQTLNGRLNPTSGQVFLDQSPLSDVSRRTVGRSIAVVAQEAELRFPVTVLEFVLGGRFAWSGAIGWGWESEQDLKIADTVLRETELSDLSSRVMNELSGGERQRAVLARALATEAPVLLLDEPTANLDLSHQARLLAVVRSRCDHAKVSSLVVTHDINLAAEFADNIFLMKSGLVVQSGTPEEVLTPEALRSVFEVEVIVDSHPVTGSPRVTPIHASKNIPGCKG